MTPTPRKLALLMALAGLGMSLPATVGATSESRAAPSRASLDEVFGFRAAETRRTAPASDSDEAAARLMVLGLPGPLPADAGDVPAREHASLPSTELVSSSEDTPLVVLSPSNEAAPATELQADSSASLPAAAAPAAVAAASTDAAADAMADALALVSIADESAPARQPAPASVEIPAFLRGPTAGRPPRTGADAHVEPWALPVATALPGFDLDLCAIDTLPAREEAKDPATVSAPILDVEIDLWADAMQEPFESEATVAPVADAAAAVTSVDIDVSGIGIGIEPDIDLGRIAGTEPAPAADIALDIPTPAPALAPVAAPREASPEPSSPLPALSPSPSKEGGGVLGVALAEAVSEARLDRVRGGFSSPDGLQVSFGIERAVYVNGSLVTTTSLNVSGLGNTTGGPPTAAATAGQLALVQNGAGNTFQTGSMNAAALGTVVQNTLNNQKIQTVTLINATVNSLQIIKSMNIGASLRGAVIDSLRR